MAYYGNLWHSTAFSSNLCRTSPHSTAISGIPRHSPAISGILRHSTAISSILRHSPAFPGILRQSTAFSGNQLQLVPDTVGICVIICDSICSKLAADYHVLENGCLCRRMRMVAGRNCISWPKSHFSFSKFPISFESIFQWRISLLKYRSYSQQNLEMALKRPAPQKEDQNPLIESFDNLGRQFHQWHSYLNFSFGMSIHLRIDST